ENGRQCSAGIPRLRCSQSSPGAIRQPGKVDNRSWRRHPDRRRWRGKFAALKTVPRLKHKAGGAIFAELLDLVVLQHAERLAWVVLSVNVGRIKDVAQLVAG